jgi:hypothetical protein
LAFYSLLEAQSSDAIDTLYTNLTTVRGAGTLLGRILGKRGKIIATSFKLVERQHHTWQANLRHAQDFFQAAEVFNAFPQHRPFTEDIADAARKFSAAVHQVGAANLSSSGEPLTDDRDVLPNTILRLLFDDNVGLQHIIYHNKFAPPLDAESPLHYGSMRGLTLDALMAFLDATEKLRAALIPIAYFDGYHFLGLVQDLRNLEKGMSPRNLHPRVVHKVFELFLMGFEGLVAQLRGCLEMSGRRDLSDRIPVGTVALKGIPKLGSHERIALQRVMRVVDQNGQYAVYTVGIPGGRAVTQLAFDLPGSGLIYLDGTTAQAAE